MIEDLFYSNSYEYLQDLLKLLDLRMYRYILSEDLQEAKALNPLKGLTISENEILKFFSKTEDYDDKEKSNKINEINVEIENFLYDMKEKLKLTKKQGVELSFEKLVKIFNLNYFEENILLIGLSVELETKYEKLYGFINDNVNKKRPSLDFALKLLNLSFEERILFKNSFVSNSFLKMFILNTQLFDSNEPFFFNEIIINNRIIDFILENKKIDEELSDIVDVYEPSFFFKKAPYKKEILENVNRAIDNFINNKDYENNLIIFLYGNTGIGKKHLVKSYSNKLDKELIIADIKILLMKDINFKEAILKVMKESVLKDAVICFSNFECILKDEEKKDVLLKEFFYAINYFMKPIFILSQHEYKNNKYFNKNFTAVFNFENTTYEERLNLWKFYSKSYSIKALDFEDLAVKFNFTPFQIKNALQSMKSKVILNNIEDDKLIYKCCYEQINSKLREKAVKVKVTYTWQQLILPEEQKKLLRDACNQVKNRYIVYEKWGFGSKFGYGKGVAMIYTGPPGTGKTMSAQVIANELNLELYRIDLSQVVSKYIGETEKSLHEIFEEASLSNAILFFDEGDSLFGKRSEVKSSNDKYANIETSYLLQKIEEYEGISIITTNFINNIDKAFLRRINYIVNYPFPDVNSRKKIWQVMLSKDSPIDEEIDFDYLSKTFEIAGGNIKNVVVYSAFLAAENNEKISMKHILMAVKYELQKMDKLLLTEDFGRYKYLLK